MSIAKPCRQRRAGRSAPVGRGWSARSASDLIDVEKEAMKLHPILAGIGILLALAACRPGAAEYTEAEAPKGLTLDDASKSTAVAFAAGSGKLLPRDAARIRALAESGAIAPSDRVTVAASGPPALAAARVATIAAALLPYHITVSGRSAIDVPANRAVIDAERYLVTLPACPNWSKQASLDFTNTLSSNYGCATAVNLGLSVARPA